MPFSGIRPIFLSADQPSISLDLQSAPPGQSTPSVELNGQLFIVAGKKYAVHPVVTNTGDVTLSDVHLVVKASGANFIATTGEIPLAPGESHDYGITYYTATEADMLAGKITFAGSVDAISADSVATSVLDTDSLTYTGLVENLFVGPVELTQETTTDGSKTWNSLSLGGTGSTAAPRAFAVYGADSPLWWKTLRRLDWEDSTTGDLNTDPGTMYGSLILGNTAAPGKYRAHFNIYKNASKTYTIKHLFTINDDMSIASSGFSGGETLIGFPEELVPLVGQAIAIHYWFTKVEPGTDDYEYDE